MIEMVLNLTQPIILNATLNATLVQPPQSILKDWLPVLVVILGGLITYYVTITIERNTQKFELKRQVYFEAAHFFSDIFQFMILYDKYTPEMVQKSIEDLEKEKEYVESKKLGEINFEEAVIGKIKEEEKLKYDLIDLKQIMEMHKDFFEKYENIAKEVNTLDDHDAKNFIRILLNHATEPEFF